MIAGLTFRYVKAYWNQIEPLIKKSLRDSTHYTTSHIKSGIESGDYQCWVYIPKVEVIGAVFITQVITYPTGFKVFFVLLAGGSGLKVWARSVWDAFKAYAEKEKCDEIYIQGREGWGKFLSEYESDLEKEAIYKVKL